MPVDPHPTPNTPLLSIGEFAAAARLSHKALRLYDQLGLLPPTQVDPSSGYRFYHPQQLATARLIRMLRAIDMPLAAIRGVLAADPSQQAHLIRAYQKSVEAHAAFVRATIGQLLASWPLKENPMTFQVEVENLAAQSVASISQNVFAADLDAHIAATLRQLGDFASSQNATVAGAPFGIYHGPINNTENGPLEVCLPLQTAVAASHAIGVRELPACTVACLTVHGPACDFPAIITAYDAIADWIHKNGYQIADSPREIWLSPPGPASEMRIAWPFVAK